MQVRKKIVEKSKDGSLKVTNGEAKATKKRGRWDQGVDETIIPAKKKILQVSSGSATPVWETDVSSNLKITWKNFYSN